MQPTTDQRRNLLGLRHGKGKREQGFTIIETMIALIVMMIAGIGVASLFIYAINYNAGAYDYTLAHSIGQQRMEHIRKASFSEITGSSEPDVTVAGHHFSVVTTVNVTSVTLGGVSTEALKTITIQVTPKGSTSAWRTRPLVLMSQRTQTALGPFFQ